MKTSENVFVFGQLGLTSYHINFQKLTDWLSDHKGPEHKQYQVKNQNLNFPEPLQKQKYHKPLFLRSLHRVSTT